MSLSLVAGGVGGSVSSTLVLDGITLEDERSRNTDAFTASGQH